MVSEYKIQGEVHPVAFNMNTLRRFCKSVGLKSLKEFDQVMQVDDEADVTIDDLDRRMTLVLEAVKEGHRITRTDCLLTLDDLFAELSDNPGLWTEVVSIMSDNMPEGKKKATTTAAGSHGMKSSR